MAILCVGTLKEPVSRNVPDVYWEYSVYAYYDYISDKKPDIEELGKSRIFTDGVFLLT